MITDRKHLETVRQSMHLLVDQLTQAWLEEQHAANAPRSGGTVAISGGGRSDPTGKIVADESRERGLSRLGARISGHHDALKRDVAQTRPRNVADLTSCWVCRLWPCINRADGRCEYCGPFHATHGRDRTLEASKAHHARLTDRPQCADPECGRDTDGGEFCPRCRKRQQRVRDQHARAETG